jgi:putative sterol carrier protein
MPLAFSDAWARAWGDAINGSPVYRQSAATWEGSIAAVAAADSDGAAPRLAVFLGVWQGECRAARAATPMDLAEAAYVLEATPGAWRDLFEGRIAPLTALMTAKVRLTRGELARLLPYQTAAKELIRLATEVKTEYPPGW